MFENSPLSLDKWFVAVWMIANCKSGVSSYKVHRALEDTQKTAWFTLHRVRIAMQTGSFIKSGGEFEADESFIGVAYTNIHKSRKAMMPKGLGAVSKEVGMGALRRGTHVEYSKVIASHIRDTSAANI